MAYPNGRRWFSVVNQPYFIVWEGDKEGWFIRAKDKSWEQRGHSKGPDAEKPEFFNSEITEEEALSALKARGLPLPPIMITKGGVEYYHNSNDAFDTGYSAYKVENDNSYYWNQYGKWCESGHLPPVIRREMQKVSTLEEAKNGPAPEAPSTFHSASNELVTAVIQTKTILTAASDNAADRMQELRRRSGQIGARIEKFKRERVILLGTAVKPEPRREWFNPSNVLNPIVKG